MRAAREHVANVLREHLPTAWRVLADESGTDVPDRPIVRVRNQRVRRAPDAPMGAYDHTVVIQLTSQFADIALAEPQLEDAMDLLLAVIEDHLGTAWDEAEKGLNPDTQTLAWDIPVHVITSRTE